jgi:hypothetical protein
MGAQAYLCYAVILAVDDADLEDLQRWFNTLLFVGIWVGLANYGWSALMCLYRRYRQPKLLKC